MGLVINYSYSPSSSIKDCSDLETILASVSVVRRRALCVNILSHIWVQGEGAKVNIFGLSATAGAHMLQLFVLIADASVTCFWE